MKRLFAMLLACVLLLSLSASAQTRQRQIALEGMTETVTETFCDSGLGFSFWYDDSMLEVDSRLGWEPCIEYVGSPDRIVWKEKLIRYILSGELKWYREAIKYDL